jgi:hypothetical protein
MPRRSSPRGIQVRGNTYVFERQFAGRRYRNACGIEVGEPDALARAGRLASAWRQAAEAGGPIVHADDEPLDSAPERKAGRSTRSRAPRETRAPFGIVAARARMARLLGDDDTAAPVDPIDLLVVYDYAAVNPASAGRHRGLQRGAWRHNWRVASNADRIIARGACRAAVWCRLRALEATSITTREATRDE